jgi:GT2 family glycosyltransferase
MRRQQAAASLAALPFRICAVLATAARAWLTLEPRHWSAVADRLQAVAAAIPTQAWLHRIRGQALRSARRLTESVAALERGLALQPGNVALQRELGRSLRLAGRWDEAVAALQKAAGAGHAGAVRDLLQLGQRAALPKSQPGVYARGDYPELVRAQPLPPPPSSAPAAFFRVSVCDGDESGSRLAVSLAGQSHAAWAVNNVPEKWAGLPRYQLSLPANACLHPDALAWLNHAAACGEWAVLRADHDHESGGQRCDPVLLPRLDRLWLDHPEGISALEARREVGGQGSCHVPLVLLTLDGAAVAPAPQTAPDADPEPLSVIIPTRDNPGMLAAAVDTLRATASRPDLLEMVIIDNGSVTPAARTLLSDLARQPMVRVVPFPEPFNWSRAGNIGARHASAGRLLFLNDDTEMQTSGWDRILAGLLADPRVALAGARMIYPDGRIQHAGFVFGMHNGPQHDGRWRDGRDAGPAGRWNAIRETVAVTGAFIAVGRDDFVAAGGFDEQGLVVDYADVDLSLRFRAQGRIVAYCGAITLLHHESVSRGLNVSRAKRQRMRREWQLTRQRWGDAVVHDPFHHPAWVRTGVPHDGLRPLNLPDILAYIDDQAIGNGDAGR